jgi:hypothetical protein
VWGKGLGFWVLGFGVWGFGIRVNKESYYSLKFGV